MEINKHYERRHYMFEKVNKYHPDKVADRVAGAIVDLAYTKNENPKCAVEVLIGHGTTTIINETDTHITKSEIRAILRRLVGKTKLLYKEVKQDKHLALNQEIEIRCGDNGIFKGSPVTTEQKKLTNIAKKLDKIYNSDGKYILTDKKLIICQSKAMNEELTRLYPKAYINPLGEWTGGTNVDSGATNRKLGSDMGDGVTGGGLHGKDLSKADVSVNIYAHLIAQRTKKPVYLSCAIGDKTINGIPYCDIVNIARKYIQGVGGFEKFAEWGLIR